MVSYFIFTTPTLLVYVVVIGVVKMAANGIRYVHVHLYVHIVYTYSVCVCVCVCVRACVRACSVNDNDIHTDQSQWLSWSHAHSFTLGCVVSHNVLCCCKDVWQHE